MNRHLAGLTLRIILLALLCSGPSLSAASIFLDNFDPDVNASQWSSIVNGAANTDCGAVSGNALKFGDIGKDASSRFEAKRGSSSVETRSATTRALDVSAGGTITFDLMIAQNGEGAAGLECESADSGEDVVLEYSTDGGSSWTLIDLYLHTNHPKFSPIFQRIPAGARTDATLFRWRQLSNSGDCCDHWALDNVQIDLRGGDGCHIGDGRINNLPDKDCGAPVAVYLGSIDVYAIEPFTSTGTLTIRLTDEQVSAVGVPSEGNLILAQEVNPFTGMAIIISRLNTGEFQLNTYYADGKPYIIVWDESGNIYHLAL